MADVRERQGRVRRRGQALPGRSQSAWVVEVGEAVHRRALSPLHVPREVLLHALGHLLVLMEQ
jgi:hypothetical protein